VQKIDYSHLLVIKAHRTQTRAGKRAQNKRRLILFGLFAVSLLLVLVVPVLAIVGLMASLIVYFLNFINQPDIFEQQLKAFAKTNGWVSGGDAPRVPAVTHAGYSPQPALVFGELDGQKFWLYEARPPIGESMIILSVELPKELPTLLLVPIGEGATGEGRYSNITARTDYGLHPFTLEGDFSERVLTYGKSGKQVAALEYMTPDVMVAIEDKVRCSVLYSGHYLSLSNEIEFFIEGYALMELFQGAQVLIKELKEKQHIL